MDQGGGKRKGAFAIYLEPWHGDIFDFLDLKKNTGKDEIRSRDLFYALWIPDLFMERVEKDEQWSLFCPHLTPGLADCYGTRFEELYTRYEKEKKYLKQISARELWSRILTSQMETGTPFMLYKDSINRKSNQKNLGTIKSSNLCTEIMEYTSPDEVAVCNLASIALNKFVEDDRTYNHQKLFDVVSQITLNLNRIIDINYYPVPEAKVSNQLHRPIGIGVQGLAEVFFKMLYPFESDEARELNEDIFETMYFAALTTSCELAKKHGTYDSYKGSPMSEGLFQFDLWGKTPRSGRHDWDGLRDNIKKHGVRNSLLIAPMPTASTSQILGNTECFEPITSNIYVRRVLSGEFPVVNKNLVRDLMKLDLWNEDMRNEIINNNGSILNISSIPDDIKELYKTVWEIKQKAVVDMAAARAPYIDQGQSLNIYMEDPDYAKLTSMHFYGWRSGLKTGMYYLRSRAVVNAVQFTVNNHHKDVDSSETTNMACSTDSPEECISCGS